MKVLVCQSQDQYNSQLQLIKHSDREIIVSWILYSIREVMGYSFIRNMVLKHIVTKPFTFGNTYSMDNTYSDIHNDIIHFINGVDKYMTFTANGSVRESKRRRVTEHLQESHYVSFVLDKEHMLAFLIDPSRDNGDYGIYYPYVGITLSSFLEEMGFEVIWVEMSSPCQINYHDVFCQTWTLYLTGKFIKNYDTLSASGNCIINIPGDQDEKYAMLLKFFKKLLNYSEFRTELRRSYREAIDNHDNQSLLESNDPCDILRNMTVQDIYNGYEFD